MANLPVEVMIYNQIKERIRLDFGLEEGDQALVDTVEGLSHLPDIIVGLIREAKRAEAFAKGMKEIISDNQARKARFETKAEKLRNLALWVMGEIGLSKLEDPDLPDLLITRRAGNQSVIITDECAIPDSFCTYTREPSKTKIREAMELGEHIPGAEWSNIQPVLTVRSK